MSKKLTVHISDKTYTALQQKAEKAGISVEDLVRRKIEPRRAVKKLSRKLAPDEEQKAREELRKCIGIFQGSDPKGADNEEIDRDLAREYGRGLEWR